MLSNWAIISPNPTTTISFELETPSEVTLAVYDVSGGLVDILLQGHVDAGYREIQWNAGKLPSGVYFCRLFDGDKQQCRIMIVLK